MPIAEDTGEYIDTSSCARISKLISDPTLAVMVFPAREMKRLGTKSFTEIAYESGFGSIRSFNRIFLSQYGETPTAHRQIIHR